MKPFKHIAFVLLLIAALPNAKGQWVIGFEVDSLRSHAIELNSARRYLDAYHALAKAKNQMDKDLKASSTTPSTLGDDDFALFWSINKSIAEVAYRLGLHSVMGNVSDTLKTCLDARRTIIQDQTPGEIERQQEIERQRMAELAKIDGDRCFLTGHFDSCRDSLQLALQWASPYDKEFIKSAWGDLAQLFYRVGKYDTALSYLDSMLFASIPDSRRMTYDPNAGNNNRFESLSDPIEIQSGRALCMARLANFDGGLRLMDSLLAVVPHTEWLYAEMLRKKAKILMLQQESSGLYDDNARKLYETYLSLTRRYVDNNFIDMSASEREQYWLAEQPFVSDCYRLEEHAPSLLYDVALFSKAILVQMGRQLREDMTPKERRSVLSNLRVTWRDVQRLLPDSSVAIEFIVYEKRDTTHLAALVLPKYAAEPQFVHISALSEIEKYIRIDGTVNDIDAVGRLIWNDRMKGLPYRNIFFAPDGILHHVGIEYMVPEELSNRKFFRLSTTRILAEKRRKIRTDSMLMVGDVDFHNASKSINSTAVGGTNDEMAYSFISSRFRRVPSLPGTREEVDSIHMLRGGMPDKVLVGDSATEETIRQLMGHYHLLLLSTHGYFATATSLGNDLWPAVTDAQLSHSCLFLSGAEKNINDAGFDASQKDGILSARELSSLDLSDVDLATLSACMSGLGYVTADGVYGLQRGLKSAGVGAIIVSLWPVSDQATSLFMQRLYANLQQGMPLHDAFFEARRQLAETKVTISRLHGHRKYQVSYNNPYYYDAFILIDAIE